MLRISPAGAARTKSPRKSFTALPAGVLVASQIDVSHDRERHGQIAGGVPNTISWKPLPRGMIQSFDILKRLCLTRS